MSSMFCVSVIIPCLNEERFIGSCLDSIFLNHYPPDSMEILIIDGMSQDSTRRVIEQKCESAKRESEKVGTRLPIVRVINNPSRQRASALNIGIMEAGGDIIIRMDARSSIPNDYIEKCINTLLETDADNVGGVLKPRVNKDGYREQINKQEAIGIALSHPFGAGNAHFRIGNKSGYVDTVYLGCFKKNIFKKVGLFDEDSAVMSEDADMNQRIRAIGGKVYLNKNIEVYYYPRDNFKDLWKLYFRYGGAKAGFLIKRHKLTSLRQVVSPIFIASMFVLPILGITNKIFLFLWFFVVGVYLTLNLLFSFSVAFRKRKFYLFQILLLAFPIIHMGWGFGFWARLFQSPNLKKHWEY